MYNSLSTNLSTPQPHLEDPGGSKAKLVLRNGLTENFVAISGKTKITRTKINGSCHNVFFGGAELGVPCEQNYTFFTDNSAEVKVWVENHGDADGAFQVCFVTV